MKLKSLAKGLLVTAALALAFVAAPAPSVRAEAGQGTYTVEKNDYLRKIAKKVYGDEELWKLIYDANSGVVKSNYIIYKGQVLAIPAVNGNAAPAAAPAPAAPVTTPAPAETPAPEASVPATPAPEASVAAPVPQAPAAEQGFTLDYNQLASWVYGGFAGMSTTGEAVIMAMDEESDYGIIIFADDDDMTAASFVGPVTYSGEYMTITDETNGLSLTCSVTEIGDGTIALDMGDLGTATINVQTREVVLDLIKTAIEGYTHVA